MREGQGCELQVLGLELAERFGPALRLLRRFQDRAWIADIRHDKCVLDARQLPDDFANLVADPDRLSGVGVAVAGHEKLRFDLTEAIENALHAEIGGSARPYRAKRGSGQHSDDGLRHVRDQRRDTVALADAARREGLLSLADCCVQLRPAHAPFDLVLAPEDERGRAVILAEQILGVVQPRALEKARILELLAGAKDRPFAAVSDHPEKIPGSRPEGVRFANREGMNVAVRPAVQPVCRVDLRHELD